VRVGLSEAKGPCLQHMQTIGCNTSSQIQSDLDYWRHRLVKVKGATEARDSKPEDIKDHQVRSSYAVQSAHAVEVGILPIGPRSESPQ